MKENKKIMNLEKKAQIVSQDMVIGVVIFLLSISVFYSYVSSIRQAPAVSMNVPSDFLLDGISLKLNSNPGDINFLGENSYSVDAAKFEKFSQLEAWKQNEIITENINLPVEIPRVDFCIFFQDNLDNVINSTGSSKITIGENGEKCGMTGFKAKPSCSKSSTHGTRIIRPVIYTSGNEKKIMRMNVMLCGTQT